MSLGSFMGTAQARCGVKSPVKTETLDLALLCTTFSMTVAKSFILSRIPFSHQKVKTKQKKTKTNQSG